MLKQTILDTDISANKPPEQPVTNNTRIKQELASLRARCPNDSNFSAPFTLLELDEALKLTKVGKAPGLDNLHPEFLKHLGNTAKKSASSPTSWTEDRCSTSLKEQK